MITKELLPLIEEGRVMVSIIPDIESVNYGRGVGYEIIEQRRIKEISTTKIREQIAINNKFLLSVRDLLKQEKLNVNKKIITN